MATNIAETLGENDPPGESGVSIDEWAAALGLHNKAVLTTHETAAVLRMSERHVREQIKEGAIPSIRYGRRVLVPVPMLLKSLLREPSDQ